MDNFESQTDKLTLIEQRQLLKDIVQKMEEIFKKLSMGVTPEMQEQFNEAKQQQRYVDETINDRETSNVDKKKREKEEEDAYENQLYLKKELVEKQQMEERQKKIKEESEQILRKKEQQLKQLQSILKESEKRRKEELQRLLAVPNGRNLTLLGRSILITSAYWPNPQYPQYLNQSQTLYIQQL